MIQSENHENNENHIIPCDKHENYKTNIILYVNYESHEKLIIPKRESRRLRKSYNSIGDQ